ncbi:MAG: hypothetical protein A2Y17_02580 [Clostridiales bacterium GWF2_38_85]|nr:MAG: hypothetical protein A2Y17_02580 [Clostridiales bacterium GWF2_38_85]
MESLEYLYHYTNIETLALIFENRTIRFNSLNKMDDLQEQETDDKTESIPMWNMYSSLNSGVRIQLRKNTFKLHDIHAEELSKILHTFVIDKTEGNPLQTIIPISEMLQKGFISIQAMTKNLLHKVEYTQEKNKLYPQILVNEDTKFTLSMDKLGKYKNIHWKFQIETC